MSKKDLPKCSLNSTIKNKRELGMSQINASDITAYSSEISGKDHRAIFAGIQRIGQEQAKRKRLLGDYRALCDYASKQGITANEMQGLLKDNFADNAKRLSVYKELLKHAPKSDTARITFRDVVEPIDAEYEEVISSDPDSGPSCG